MNRAPAIVFGGGGFIGTNLCRRLVAAGRPVRAFSRRRRFPMALSGVEWITGDFANVDAVGRALQRDGIVYHLIPAAPPHTADDADLETSLAPVNAMLEMCRAAGVSRVVFVSSGGTVYGAAAQTPTPESAPVAPITPYARGNVAIERRLDLLHQQDRLEIRVLRVTNPFGPYQTAIRSQGVIAALVGRGLRDQRIEIWGDGSVVRDFIYIDDVVDALALAADDPGGARLINIGSGQGRSIRDVIAAVEGALGKPLAIDWKPGRPSDIPVSVVAIDRARTELGWTPQTDFAEGVRATVAWWRQERAE